MSPELPAICDKDQRLDVVNGQVLCAAQVVEIYKHKLCLLEPNSFESCLQTAESRIKGQSGRIAGMFGVSPKTVRDIWNHRTWAYATHHLWAQEEGGTASSSCLASHVRHYSPVKYFLFYPFACTIFSFLMCLLSMQAVGLPKRARGRPKGSRDTKPRAQRRTAESPHATVAQTSNGHFKSMHGKIDLSSIPASLGPKERSNGAAVADQSSNTHSSQGHDCQNFLITDPGSPLLPNAAVNTGAPSNCRARQSTAVANNALLARPPSVLPLPTCVHTPLWLQTIYAEPPENFECQAAATVENDPFHADWPHW